MTNEYISIISVLALSIIIQVTAAIMAIKLIAITGRRSAWSLIALALVLMALRRVVPLYRLLTGDSTLPPDLLNEVIGLVLSVVMAAGIARIAPLFIERKQIEETLQVQYSTLHSILESVDAFIFSVDRGYRYTSFNTAHASLMQIIYGAKIQPGHNMLDYMTVAEDRETAKQNLDRALAGERLVESAYSGEEMRSRLCLEVSHNPVRMAGGTVIGVAVLSRDITEQKKAEIALRESEAKYRIVADNTYDWEFWLNPEGQFIYTSPSCKRITGHDPDEFIANPGLLLEIIHPDDRLSFESHRKEAEMGKLREDFQFRVIAPNGDMHWIGHVCQPVFDNDGNFMGTRGNNRDITRQRLSEDVLEEQYSTLHSIIESVDALIFSVDGEYRYTSFNTAHASVMQAIYGAKIQPGNSLLDYMTVAEDRETAKKNLDRALAGERLVESAYSGEEMRSRLYFEVSHNPILTEDGTVIGVVVLSRNVTEQKRVEEELLERERHSQSLLRLSKNLEQAQTYAEILNAAQGEVRNMIGYQSLWVYLLTEDKKYCKSLVAGGPISETVMSDEGTATLTVEGDRMLEEIVEAKGIVVVEDAQTDERVNKEIVARLGNRTLVNIPIILFDRHLGSVGMGTFGDEGVRVPTESEQKYLAALASHMAAALDRIHLLTERKQAERALKESEEKYRVLSETSTDIILTHDLKGQITYINRSGLRIMEYSEADLIGGSIAAVMSPDELVEMDKRANARRSGETGTWEYETKIISKSGKHVFVEVHSTPIIKEGQNTGVLVNARDITERKQAEESLKRSEEKYRTLIRKIQAAVIVHGADTQILTSNPMAQELLGLTEDQMLGKTAIDSAWHFFFEDGTATPLDEYPVNLVLSSRKTLRNLILGVHRPQKENDVWVLVNADPVFGRENEITQVIVTFIDITERKRAEEALHRLNRELQAISNCNQALMRAVDEQTLLNDICRIICDEAGYRMAWVGYAENNAARTVRPVAWAGVENGYLATANITWSDTERGRGPTGTAIRSGESACIRDFTMEPQASPWRENTLQRGYRSSIAMPLKNESANTFGALTIYATETDAFTPDEMRLLEELAGDLAFGIVVLRTRAERKRAEETLRYLASIVQSSDDAIIGKTLDGMITSWNKGAERIYGYTESEMIGRPVSVLAPPELTDDVPLILAKIKTGEHIAHYETVRQRKDGQRIYMSLTVSPLLDAEGKIAGASTIGRDITERKQAEQAVREGEAKFRAVIEQSAEGIALIDEQGSVIEWNQAIERMTGLASSDVINVPLWDVMMKIVIPEKKLPQQYEFFKATILEALKTGKSHLFTRPIEAEFYPWQGGDGEKHYIHQTIFPVKTEKGFRIASLNHDITERKRTDEAIRAAGVYNRSLIEASLDPLVTIGPDGKITDVNEATETVTGVSREHLIGDDFSNYFTEPQNARVGYQKVLSDGMVRDYPLTIRHTSGKTIDVLYNATVYNTESGELQGVFAAARDITEQKRGQEALRASENRFRVLSDNAFVGIYILQDGLLSYVNSTLAKMFGYTPDELVGADPRVVIHPDDHALVSENIRRRIVGEVETAHYEFRGRCKDGEIKHIEVLGGRVDLGGRPAIIGNLMDITDRKRAEEEIARSFAAEKKARRLAEILREANESLSRTLKLDDVLQNLLRYLGYLVPYDSANVMLLEGDFQLHVVALSGYEHWTDFDATRELVFDIRTIPSLNELITTQKSILISNTYEYPGWVRVTGTEHVVSWLGIPIIADRQVIGLYSVDKVEPEFFTDEHRLLAEGLAAQAAVAIQNTRLHDQITRANVELEQRVADRTAQLEAANKELEAFAYSVSHDLRAPLRHINGFIELLQKRSETTLDAQSQHYVDVISNAAQKMGTLIDDLLSFSRMGRNEMSKSQVDLNELVQDIIQEFKPEIEDRDVQWKISPLPWITGDRAMLRVVLVNLISNALKFTRPRKTAQIEIGCERQTDAETIIFVRDNGVGFDMNYVGKIFNVFQRLHRAEEFEGTGIGLANVHRVVSRHGGRIWAEGKVDGGATFHISFPRMPGGKS